jgi:hypothetical protein
MLPNLVSLFALRAFLLTDSLETVLRLVQLEPSEISPLDFAKKNAHSPLFLTPLLAGASTLAHLDSLPTISLPLASTQSIAMQT